MGIAPLPGFCKWLVEEGSWRRVDESATDWHDDAHSWQAQREAVQAVARCEPRPGRESPHDDETLAAARRSHLCDGTTVLCALVDVKFFTDKA